MSPDDVAIVDRSWAELSQHRGALVAHIATGLDVETGLFEDRAGWLAKDRAEWLVGAVADLVGLLPSPSRLAERARALAASWPCPCALPTFQVDGRAFLHAARLTSTTWTPRTDRAWRHAWLLLADELAEQSLSPFADPLGPRQAGE